MEKPLSGLKDKEHLTTLLSEQQKKNKKVNVKCVRKYFKASTLSDP